jgi:hypothetical protein
MATVLQTASEKEADSGLAIVESLKSPEILSLQQGQMFFQPYLVNVA